MMSSYIGALSGFRKYRDSIASPIIIPIVGIFFHNPQENYRRNMKEINCRISLGFSGFQYIDHRRSSLKNKKNKSGFIFVDNVYNLSVHCKFDPRSINDRFMEFPCGLRNRT